MKKTFQKKGAKNWKDNKKKEGYAGGKKFGDRGRGSSGSWQRDGERAERPMMHAATCSQCHAPCEVPFKPNGKKPIYCRDCFRKEGGGDARTSYSGAPRFGSTRSRSSDSTVSHSSAYEKPAYRSSSVSAPRAGNDDIVKQLKELNVKMDKILDALTSLAE